MAEKLFNYVMICLKEEEHIKSINKHKISNTAVK